MREVIEGLHWLGHASFRLDCAKTIYFDPFKVPSGAKLADIILVTHGHFDHLSEVDIRAISTSASLIVAGKKLHKQLGAADCKKIEGLSPGDTLDIDGIRIKAVLSYNTDKEFHPRDSGGVGFIVDIGGVSIYHAGDTDFIPEMADFRCDIALLPVSGTYVMSASEAARAALAIRPKVAIPMHYGDIVGTVSDAEKFRELLRNKIEVKILTKEGSGK